VKQEIITITIIITIVINQLIIQNQDPERAQYVTRMAQMQNTYSILT